MKEVNALKLRNNLGEILEQLTKTGDAVLISKGKKGESRSHHGRAI